MTAPLTALVVIFAILGAGALYMLLSSVDKRERVLASALLAYSLVVVIAAPTVLA